MIPQIDKILMKIRLPIESSRDVRSLNERSHYKASEWLNIAFYLALPLLKNYLPYKYVNNLIKYVVFLRILCQDTISKTNLIESEPIFTEFIKEYQNLFGKDNMTSNLHGHLH